MARYTGVLRRVDLGSGGWALDTGSGSRVLLTGDVPAALAGRSVVVEGAPAGAFGFLMTGDPTVEVRSIRAAS